MTYTDKARQIDLRGAVRVDDADGVLHARSAVVYLQPVGAASNTTKAAPSGFPAGSIDHMVANGKIEMEQPGRLATGEQLTYTAADGVFVLTGTKAAPPKVVDETQGTVTGESMRFKTGEDSILVSGSSDGTNKRVHTETRMKE